MRTEFGVGTYTRNIVRALGRLDRESKYFLIGPPEKVAEMGPLPPNFHAVPLLGNDATIKSYFDYRAILKRLNCDLVHIPHLFWLPRNLPCPYVMTVHDVLDHMYRARNQSGLKRSSGFSLTHRALKGAARIFAVSNFTKSEVEKLFGIPAESYRSGVQRIDERFLATAMPATADRQLLARALPGHPSFPALHRSYQSAQERGANHRGLFGAESGTGERRDFSRSEVDHHRRRAFQAPGPAPHRCSRRMQNDVRFMGFVPIEVLRIFYDAAKIFVFPSLYEGFGLPPLEAMAHGTPVVTSNTSSLPEVVGNAAVLVNPENVFEIMRALHRVLIDQALRDKLKERGYEQAKRFSWDASARQILRVYHEVTDKRTVKTEVADEPVKPRAVNS